MPWDRSESLDFPGSPAVNTPHFQHRGSWIWSLVRELRSHVPHSAWQAIHHFFKKKRIWILYSLSTNHKCTYAYITNATENIFIDSLSLRKRQWQSLIFSHTDYHFLTWGYLKYSYWMFTRGLPEPNCRGRGSRKNQGLALHIKLPGVKLPWVHTGFLSWE